MASTRLGIAKHVATVTHIGSGCGYGQGMGITVFQSLSSDKTLKVHLVEDKQVIRSAAISNLVHLSLNMVPPSSLTLPSPTLSFLPSAFSFPPSLSFPLPSLICCLDKEAIVTRVSIVLFLLSRCPV